MGLVDTIKQTLGMGDAGSEKTYECQDCGTTFESYLTPDDAFLSCEECDSKNLTKISES